MVEQRAEQAIVVAAATATPKEIVNNARIQQDIHRDTGKNNKLK